MALITTIAEIKTLLPRLVSNLSADSTLPNFDRAEEKYLIPLTGRDLYNDIKAKKLAATLTADETTLLKHMQLVICAYAFLDEMAFNHAKITDMGVRTMTTDKMPKAVGWEYKELKTALQDHALDGVEVLLAALVSQAPALWTASTEYNNFKSLLIKTGLEFDSIVRLYQPQRTFWNIRTVVSDVQDNYLRNTLGPDLLEYLRDKASPTDEETSILKYLKKALAQYSIKHAIEHYTTRFDVGGFTVVSYVGDMDSVENGGRTTAKDLMDFKMKACDRDASAYLAKAVNECYQYYQGSASSEFKTAYDGGPLASYVVPGERDKGNGTRKLFRF